MSDAIRLPVAYRQPPVRLTRRLKIDLTNVVTQDDVMRQRYRAYGILCVSLLNEWIVFSESNRNNELCPLTKLRSAYDLLKPHTRSFFHVVHKCSHFQKPRALMALREINELLENFDESMSELAHISLPHGEANEALFNKIDQFFIRAQVAINYFSKC